MSFSMLEEVESGDNHNESALRLSVLERESKDESNTLSSEARNKENNQSGSSKTFG